MKNVFNVCVFNWSIDRYSVQRRYWFKFKVRTVLVFFDDAWQCTFKMLSRVTISKINLSWNLYNELTTVRRVRGGGRVTNMITLTLFKNSRYYPVYIHIANLISVWSRHLKCSCTGIGFHSYKRLDLIFFLDNNLSIMLTISEARLEERFWR